MGRLFRASKAAGNPKSEITRIAFYQNPAPKCFFVLQGYSQMLHGSYGDLPEGSMKMYVKVTRERE